MLVSTATKNLQEQLHKKDVPFLQQIIPRDFKVTCMKGRSNYVCLYRMKKAAGTPMLEGLEDVDYFDQIRKWAGESETGDRAELTDLPEDLSFWPQIDARADTCLGQKCPDFDACFITRMRRESMEADIVIVNHHLFFADLALRGGDYGSVLPDYNTVIFDEAHELEDVAASYFGTSVSNYRVNDLVQDANKLEIKETEQQGELIKALARLSQRSDTFWLSFRGVEPDDEPAGNVEGTEGSGGWRSPRSTYRRRTGAVGSPDGRYPLSNSRFARADREGNLTPTATGEAYIALNNAIDRLTTTLGVVTDAPAELDNIVRRAQGLKFELEFIVSGDQPDFVAAEAYS